MELPIRPVRPTDHHYIIKSWVMSLRGQFPFSKMSADAICKYSRRVEALLDTAITIVACDPINPDVVYGFACGEAGRYLGVESPTLHYVWVRKNVRDEHGNIIGSLRRRGIGTSLVHTLFPNGESLIYTHITKVIHHAKLEKKWNLCKFDPYFVEGALYAKARNLDKRAIQRNSGGVVSPVYPGGDGPPRPDDSQGQQGDN